MDNKIFLFLNYLIDTAFTDKNSFFILIFITEIKVVILKKLFKNILVYYWNGLRGARCKSFMSVISN